MTNINIEEKTQTTKNSIIINNIRNASGNLMLPNLVLDIDDVSLTDNTNVLHVLYGSRTGNSKAVAELACNYAKYLGYKAKLINMRDFQPEKIKYLKNLIVAVSTHGEGVPPIAAEGVLNFLKSSINYNLSEMQFSVIGLGDSNYKYFSKTGSDFEQELLKLGASRLAPIVKCDLDFEEVSILWVKETIELFQNLIPTQTKNKNGIFDFKIEKSKEGADDVYMARVLDKFILNGAGSSKKTMHLSLSLEKSGISYKPGDAIGIYSFNSGGLVDSVLEQLGFDATYVISHKQTNRLLRDILTTDYELTLLTPLVVKNYAKLVKQAKLSELIEEEMALEKYCEFNDVLDLITDFPQEISISEFLSVIRRLPYRLYSVASSQKKHANEVHLTVGKIEYYQGLRNHEGVCSSFLSERIKKGESIGIYLYKNEKFYLPKNEKDIIMIGAGTGLAPYRGFLQEREVNRATGKSWLFFGERNESTDYLYQQELKEYLKKGVLTRLSTAFSRDQEERIYVNDRMLAEGVDLYRWIKQGAIIYLCGNKRTLAKSVYNVLLEIIQKEEICSVLEAQNIIKELKTRKQFIEDVY